MRKQTHAKASVCIGLEAGLREAGARVGGSKYGRGGGSLEEGLQGPAGSCTGVGVLSTQTLSAGENSRPTPRGLVEDVRVPLQITGPAAENLGPQVHLAVCALSDSVRQAQISKLCTKRNLIFFFNFT